VRGNEINMIQVKGGRCVRRSGREALKIAGVVGSEKGSFSGTDVPTGRTEQLCISLMVASCILSDRTCEYM